ncbi:MAG: hypothetical protein GXC73_19285 [Chitinophagaceae bacterium]|nr:hypothetical protein [Chitinophagaceae bacterium]
MKLIASFLLITTLTYCSVFAQNSTGMPSGNIGIGTTSPSNLLQVHNDNFPGNNIGNVLEIANFSALSPNYAQFKFLLRRHTTNNIWENTGARLQFRTDASDQGYLEFNPIGDPWGMAFGSNQGEFLRLKGNGNIGIGTTSPEHKLDVRGNIYTNASVYIDGGDLILNRTSHAYGYVARPNVAGYKKLQFAVAGGGPLEELIVNSDFSYFAGNVGIGTTPPGSYKLAVDGTIGARKIKITQSSWADYVFDKDYHLPSLRDVEEYIKRHGHLPEMPTTEEVIKDGVDIGDTQVLLLKKIEELTLYLIEQNNQIIEQNRKLNEQQKLIQLLQSEVQTLKLKNQ